MSVGTYITLAGLRLRLHGPAAGSSADDGLMAEICSEVNDFIESSAERVLAPVPTFSSTFSADAGDTALTLGSAAGLAVGDDLLLGLLSGDHETATVLAISANLAQDASDWASAEYSLDDVVQPTSHTGHTYRCVSAGTSGDDEPTFPADGSAIGDGEVIWLDLGTTNASVAVRSPLLHNYSEKPCQRVIVADGFDAVERQRCLLIPIGVLSLAALETANRPDSTFKSIDPVDFYLQPGRASLRPGWPQTEVWLSPKRSYTRAGRNVRLIGPGPCVDMDDEPAFGFPRIPDVIRTVAYNVAVTRWAMKSSGGAYEVAPGNDQVAVGSYLLSRTDWFILQDHARGWTIA